MGLLSKAAAIRNAAVSNPGAEASAVEIHSLMYDFQKNNPSFHCMVLGAPQNSVAGLVAHFGVACNLPDNNCLALFPGDMDRELIAHRLSESARAAALALFTAASTAEAFEALGPYL